MGVSTGEVSMCLQQPQFAFKLESKDSRVLQPPWCPCRLRAHAGRWAVQQCVLRPWWSTERSVEKPSFLEEDAKAFLAEPDHQENTEFGWKRRDERMVVLGRQSSIRPGIDMVV